MGIETFRPHPRGGGSPTHACHSIPSYNDPLNDLGYRCAFPFLSLHLVHADP